MKDRVSRINELIKRELSGIFLKENDFPPELLVTITRVETSANLIQAKTWISVLPEAKVKVVMKILNDQIYHLQQEINRKLKMRPVPRLIFKEEKQIIKASRVEELLEEIKKEPGHPDSLSK